MNSQNSRIQDDELSKDSQYCLQQNSYFSRFSMMFHKLKSKHFIRFTKVIVPTQSHYFCVYGQTIMVLKESLEKLFNFRPWKQIVFGFLLCRGCRMWLFFCLFGDVADSDLCITIYATVLIPCDT